MNRMVRNAIVAAPALAVLLALSACGDRVENTEHPLPNHASVEINRQGMEGAQDPSTGNGVEHHTASSGEETQRRGLFAPRG